MLQKFQQIFVKQSSGFSFYCYFYKYLIGTVFCLWMLWEINS